MKVKMKKLFLTLVVCTVLSCYVAPSVPVHAADANTTVYVTKTGTKYHSDGCRYLRSSQYAITLGDAIRRGYTACSVCHAHSWTQEVIRSQNNTQTNTATVSETTVTSDTTGTSNSTDVSAQTTDVTVSSEWAAVYDEAYYLAQNPDLAAAFGSDSNAIFQHFITSGIYEGRSASPDFNALTYKANYPDLQGAFGDDLLQYVKHYMNSGKAEGRKGI